MSTPYPEPYPDSYPPPDGDVPYADTQVVGTRVVQYIIDAIVSGLLATAPFLLLLATPRTETGSIARSGVFWLLVLIASVLSLLVLVWYWVLRPATHRGRTFAMGWFGIRVVSQDGGEATRGQLAIRWVLLIVDGAFNGLVGLIAILVSPHNQRIGDMAARTLVIRDQD